MLKMIQEYMNMIKRETVNVKKKKKKTCRNENHNISSELKNSLDGINCRAVT